MKKIGNGICIVLGFLFLGLGALGAVLPVLPATPFLLMAAALFAKGSKRFHRWFTGTGLYRTYIEQAVKNKSMKREAKRKMLVVLTIIFAVAFLSCPVWPAKILIAVVAAGHLYYFGLRVRTTDGTIQQKRMEKI